MPIQQSVDFVATYTLDDTVLSAKHNFEEFSLLVRANVYGSYENAIDSAATNIQKYGSESF
ncbi:MAG: hypothetical protein ACSHWT_00410 [Glaciecola sp.]